MSNTVDYGINIDLKMGDILSTIKDIATSFKGLSKVVSITTDKIDELEEASSKITYYEKLSKSADEYSKKVDIQRAKVEKLNKALQNEELTDKQRQRKIEQLERATARLTKMTEKQDQYNDSLRETSDYLKRAGVNTDDLANEQSRLNQEIQKTTQRMAKQKQAMHGIHNVGKGIKGTFSGLADLSKDLSQIGMVGGAGVLGLGALAANSNKAFAQQVDALKTTADAFNLSTQELQVWQFAGEGVGVKADKTVDILKDVSDKIGDFATTGGGEAKDLFETLKLDVKEFKDLRPDEALLKVGKALDQSTLTKSQKIFLLESIADEASRLQPLIENNGEALNKARDAAENYGLIISDLEKDSLDESRKGWVEIGKRVEGIKTRVGLIFNDFLLDTGVFDVLSSKLEDLAFDIEWFTATGELDIWIKDTLEGFFSLAREIKEAVSSVLAFGQRIIEIGQKISSFVGGWENLLMILVSIKGIVMAAGVISGIVSLASGIGAIGTALVGVSMAMKAGPFGIMVAGAAAATWAIKELYEAYEILNQNMAQHAKAVEFKEEAQSSDSYKKYRSEFDTTLSAKEKGWHSEEELDAMFRKWLKEQGRQRAENQSGASVTTNESKIITLKQPENTIPAIRAQQVPTIGAEAGKGRLDIRIDSPVPAQVTNLESDGMEISVHTGPMGVFQ